jgi:hypothetical protein
MGENRVARWQDGDIIVTSRRPLIGRLNLIGSDGPLQLELDRRSAEALAIVLRDFLGKDSGGAPAGKALADKGLRPEELNASNDE